MADHSKGKHGNRIVDRWGTCEDGLNQPLCRAFSSIEKSVGIAGHYSIATTRKLGLSYSFSLGHKSIDRLRAPPPFVSGRFCIVNNEVQHRSNTDKFNAASGVQHARLLHIVTTPNPQKPTVATQLTSSRSAWNRQDRRVPKQETIGLLSPRHSANDSLAFAMELFQR